MATEASSDKIKIYLIKTNNGCFISTHSKTGGYEYTYVKSKIPDLIFDGKEAEETYCKNWYYISEYPKLIQCKVIGEQINKRYELTKLSLKSEEFPEVIPAENVKHYDEDVICTFYKYKYDIVDDYLVDVDCEIETIFELEDFELSPKVEFKAVHRQSFSDKIYTIRNEDIHHQMLDKMIFPEILLSNRPAKFTSKEVYNITRQYILDNIDNNVARITSNYDFCFEVSKIIPLNVPETITYQNFLARTKKEREKIHTKVKSFEEHKIFSMTSEDDKYKGYPIIPEMCANSDKGLKERMDSWLEYVIEEINKPIYQCRQCNGKGYVGLPTGRINFR